MKLPQKIIDTNVILRFFLADNEKEFLKTKEFFGKLEFGEDEALLTEIVFVEVIWVLHKVYGIPRKEICLKYKRLVDYKGIKTVFSKEIFLESLNLYTSHSYRYSRYFFGSFSKV
ncbi:MAG: type II toxin-antitoxin system VapC family toxin [Candidatus Jettenia sp.]|uniref:PIN domain-containing protein n=1 Tax=Candidatus Jettenia sp. AMX1 TaxID=2293637 RepID=UPI000687A20D|nr:PIN domain-containing protein [Candidatus Jettenia sp. AMX1]MBC6928752.1 type II toxin-antitoxin system VapC family toxin [Candidatus Jettenia sp.]NUN24885.1 PIN domain-containing protein [Candidatus Jettenia caeni]KAA0250724.1 MAG: type II toxin-antitoxin system VapC family toxin [Candidatus Jettenia sp. AMX1]MCE7880064.1 type II toxin-antitoxin system VapC family toxin [Candidatus Jettenia sp. AMX1]MCQ3926845.1 type II toxin-antitoxin system VapC family toxin [Candidatus Jettenia sp.]